jgi:hypothetical protein
MAIVQPLINGIAQSYVQCTANAWGIDIFFTELNYKETQNKQNNYNNGKYAITRTYGKIENSSASITIDGNQNDKLRAIAPSRRALHSLPPTDLRITYGQAGQPTTTDIIKGFEFKDNGKEGSVDDDYFTVSLEFIFTNIE